MSYSWLVPENLPLQEQLMEQNYGNAPQGVPEVQAMAKSDAPVLSTVSGFYNAVFGASVFEQLNNSSVLFNMLPKFTYQRAGYRPQTTRFLNSGLGAAENASIADAVIPTELQVTVGIKEQQLALSFSERMRLLATAKDDMGFDAASYLERAKNSFAYALDADLNAGSVLTTTAGNNTESIARVVSSYSEYTNCSGSGNSAHIYGVSRHTAASWADSQVLHNSGTTRLISESLVRQLQQQTRDAGANPKTQVWYTGTDTYEQLQGLFQTQMRYVSPETFIAGTNINDSGKGVGANFGMEMATLFGKPIFVNYSGKMPADGTAGTGTAISDLFLLDIGYDKVYNEPNLGIKVLRAPIVAETRLETYPAHQKLGTKQVIYSAMELECKRFNIQGKLRDISSAV